MFRRVKNQAGALSDATITSSIACERFLSSSIMASFSDSLYPGGTRIAASPSFTRSGTPPALVATIRTRAAMLSSKTLREPPDKDGSTKRS